MADEFQEDVLAELAILNSVAIVTMRALLQGHGKADINQLFEKMSADLQAANYWGIDSSRLDTFLGKVDARWTSLAADILRGVPPAKAPGAP